MFSNNTPKITENIQSEADKIIQTSSDLAVSVAWHFEPSRTIAQPHGDPQHETDNNHHSTRELS